VHSFFTQNLTLICREEGVKKMKKINMKNKSNGKSLEEGFNEFILEHCQLKNLRPKTEKHYKELIKYSFNFD